MPPFVDKKNLVELSIGLFGILSVYLIYGLIYEKIIMSSYEISNTKTKQFFTSTAGLVFIERGLSWIFTELAFMIWGKKQQKSVMPQKRSIFCGFLIFLSAIVFTHGVYTLSYRFSFMLRTGIFTAATVLGWLYSNFKPLYKKPKVIDIFLSLGILGGMILFWVFDPEICFYVPIEGKVFAAVIVCISCGTDGIVSIVQTKITEDYKPSALYMMRQISRWTALFSLLLVLTIGDLGYIVEFCQTHLSFTLEIVLLSVLYFIGQLFIYRGIKNMAQNFPAFLSSSRKVLNIHISFVFTVHKYHPYQLIGVIISWTSIFLQAIFMLNNQNDPTNKNKPLQPYNEMMQISSEDGQNQNH